jgi:hypothetical protein
LDPKEICVKTKSVESTRNLREGDPLDPKEICVKTDLLSLKNNSCQQKYLT